MGGKALKEGTGAATVTLRDTTYIYLLKGSGTMEFYRYNTATNAWETKANAPGGTSGKGYKNGSCIAASADGKTIIALKGSYDDVASYNVDSNVWTNKTSLPLVGSSGKKKKVKDGAGIAYLNGYYWALKGDNTREFWQYQADSDKWLQRTSEDLPAGGGKNVKGGGALISTGAALYALKGNNTLEFFSYGAAAALGLPPADNSNIQSNTQHPTPNTQNLHVSPNPFTNATTISYSLPRAGNVNLKLYDVTGKLVTILASGHHNAGTSSFIVHRPSFAGGIYILKLETDNTTTTSKLIIE
jgi:hypothetical protein